ncbi:MAG TPA: ROK family protein [Acidimicrobiales bacterium]|nr:ROK family protein [Acidimicrobiales bacterium]
MSNVRREELSFVGAIEAGGTKIVCSAGRKWQTILDSEKYVVATTSPEETVTQVLDWFSVRHEEENLQAFGIASFGPIDFATQSIAATTPKEAWRGFNWRDAVNERFGRFPIGFDTDTNAAGIAEWRWGNAQGRGVAVYLTVGTGIGGALIVDGAPIHGLLHPEFGHMFVPRQQGDGFVGTCPVHGDCLEGLASGPAVSGRWGRGDGPFPPNHPAWELESDYLSLAMVNIITITSPEVIVLGGGVMAVEGLLDKVREKTVKRLGGYLAKDELGSKIGGYIVSPGLGNASGVVGAYSLGLNAYVTSNRVGES